MICRLYLSVLQKAPATRPATAEQWTNIMTLETAPKPKAAYKCHLGAATATAVAAALAGNEPTPAATGATV